MKKAIIILKWIGICFNFMIGSAALVSFFNDINKYRPHTMIIVFQLIVVICSYISVYSLLVKNKKLREKELET